MLTGREAFLAKLQERELMARERLSAATGHQSLCRVPSGPSDTAERGRPAATGGQRRSAKYHEGAAVALADVRRAVRSRDDDVVSTIGAVRASWDAQVDLPGRTAAAWVDYLEGGRDALIQLEELEEEDIS